MTGRIEYRVCCRGLQPRYFASRLEAHRYAQARPHLRPVTWWRRNHGRGTGPWIDIEHTQPEHTTP